MAHDRPAPSARRSFASPPGLASASRPPSTGLRPSAGAGAAGAEAASRAHQAARSRLALRQLDEAEALARRARESDAGNVEYAAFHAWVRVQRGELSNPKAAAEIVAVLRRAVLADRDNLDVRFYRAQVFKLLGRHEEALKDFRFIVRRQPQRLDAVRELRLYELRARNERARSGLFARLFLR